MSTNINFNKRLGFSGSGTSEGITLPSSSFDGMILEWTLPSATTIYIRGYSGKTYNYDVDWGDGNTESGVTTYSKTHAYAAAGTYQVKISGDFAGFRMDNITGTWKSYLTRVIQWGNIQFTTFYGAFANCDGLTSIPAESPDLSNLTGGAFKMFYACSKLTSLDLSNWTNTGNFSGSGKSALYGLYKCTSLNLTGWDTSNLTDTQDFLSQCGRTAGGCTITAPNLDWSGTGTLYRMFYRACLKADSDISNWTLNASGVSLSRFFYESGTFSSPTFSSVSEVDMSTWNNTSAITSMQYFAYNANSLKNINVTNWDTSNVTNMYRAFWGSQQIQEIIGLSTIDVSSVVDASQMFYNTRRLKFDNHNFGSSWNNWAAVTSNFAQFFYRNGYSLGASSRGVVPTVSAWSMPNASGSMYETFREAKYAAGSTLTINWNHPNCSSLQKAFYLQVGISTMNMNMTTTNALTNMVNFARQSTNLSTIVFGSNMDFSGVTDTSTAFYQISTTPTTLTFDAGADFGALTTAGSIVGSGSVRKMTTASYDALLVRLEATNSNTVSLNVNVSQYTAGSAAATARAALIADHSWTITDGGSV